MLEFDYSFNFNKHVVPLMAECLKLNESYVIYDTLRYCGLIDQDLVRTSAYKEIYFSGYDGDKYVGFCGLSVYNDKNFKDFVMISWLLIKEDLRSKGYGAELLAEAERYVKLNYPNTKDLYVESDVYTWDGDLKYRIDADKRVIKFYKRNGYKELGVVGNLKQGPTKDGFVITNEIPEKFLEDDCDIMMVKHLKG